METEYTIQPLNTRNLITQYGNSVEGMAQTDAPARQSQPNNHLERVREGEREKEAGKKEDPNYTL